MRLATAEDAAALAMVFLAARRAAMPYLPVLYIDAEILHWIEAVILPRSPPTCAASPSKPLCISVTPQAGMPACRAAAQTSVPAKLR